MSERTTNSTTSLINSDRGQVSRSVRLRKVELADLPFLFQFQLDPVANHMAVVNPRSETEFDIHWKKVLGDPDVVARSILADEMLVGSISCFKMDGLDSVGYWIAKKHWGKGIATKALSLLLQEVTVRPLHARAARQNRASIRVLQRCGFQIVEYRFSPAEGRFLACEEAILLLK